jgi:IclR family pca regulon transcriptional regulator
MPPGDCGSYLIQEIREMGALLLKMPDRNYIHTIERGLKILEIFGTSARKLTLTEVADLCRMNKTAVNRFLHTLCILGYLNRDEMKRYSLSPRVLSLGFAYLNSSNLRSVCKPHIDELSAELNQTVNLAILDDLYAIYLYRKERKRFLNVEAAGRLNRRPGCAKRRPFCKHDPQDQGSACYGE